jgi:hypothetical protein
MIVAITIAANLTNDHITTTAAAAAIFIFHFINFGDSTAPNSNTIVIVHGPTLHHYIPTQPDANVATTYTPSPPVVILPPSPPMHHHLPVIITDSSPLSIGVS